MTAQERQALWFLLALTALGTGVRVVRGRQTPLPVAAADSLAFDHQLRAVDSALTSKRSKGKAKGTRKPPIRASEGGKTGANPAEIAISAFPELRDGGEPQKPSTSRGDWNAGSKREAAVDLDVASREEIETLPWVGPALAERIVSNRTRCGPFGSIEALKRVAGIGDGIAERLSERVTFSAVIRPSFAAPPQCQRGHSAPGNKAPNRRP